MGGEPWRLDTLIEVTASVLDIRTGANQPRPQPREMASPIELYKECGSAKIRDRRTLDHATLSARRGPVHFVASGPAVPRGERFQAAPAHGEAPAVSTGWRLRVSQSARHARDQIVPPTRGFDDVMTRRIEPRGSRQRRAFADLSIAQDAPSAVPVRDYCNAFAIAGGAMTMP